MKIENFYQVLDMWLVFASVGRLRSSHTVILYKKEDDEQWRI